MRKYLLVLAQVFNLLLPFAILPMLSSRLGAEKFGEYAVWISVASFLTIISDWGFNVYGVSKVSALDTLERAFVFLIEVTVFKLLIGLIIILGGVFFLSALPNFGDVFSFLASSSIILGGILYPLWFYNGINKVGLALAVILLCRILQLILTYYFIVSPSDLNFALFMVGLPQIISVILFFIILRMVGSSFFSVVKLCTLAAVRKHASESVGLFLSSALTSSIITLSTAVLGNFVNKGVVGSFYIADRGVRALLSLYSAFSSGVQAEFGALKGDDLRRAYIGRQLIIATALSLVFLGAYFYVGNFFIFLFAGKAAAGVVEILNFYVFIVPIVIFSNIFGVQILLSAFKYSDFSRNITAGVVLYWLAVFPVGLFAGVNGFLSLLLAVEIFILFCMCRSCKIHRLI